MLAGQPTNLNVTALRREEVPQDPEQQPDVMATPDLGLDAIEETPLDPIASAAAAIEAADAAPAASAPPKPRPSGLTKPYIQIGIFSVETNARNTATAMRTSGIVPTVRKQSSSGKTFWRVIVGPATSASERAGLLKKVKAAGFSDAYAVTN
jgi:cell division septation protein DedD